jgi:hypothetical protein
MRPFGSRSQVAQYSGPWPQTGGDILALSLQLYTHDRTREQGGGCLSKERLRACAGGCSRVQPHNSGHLVCTVPRRSDSDPSDQAGR